MSKQKLAKLGMVVSIGMLMVGLIGAPLPSAHAQTATPPQAPAALCTADQANDGTEVKSAGADTDTIDLQCGDQTGPDAAEAIQGASGSAAEAVEPASGPDTDNVQEGQGQQVEDGQPDVSGAVEAPDAALQSPAK